MGEFTFYFECVVRYTNLYRTDFICDLQTNIVKDFICMCQHFGSNPFVTVNDSNDPKSLKLYCSWAACSEPSLSHKMELMFIGWSCRVNFWLQYKYSSILCGYMGLNWFVCCPSSPSSEYQSADNDYVPFHAAVDEVYAKFNPQKRSVAAAFGSINIEMAFVVDPYMYERHGSNLADLQKYILAMMNLVGPLSPTLVKCIWLGRNY